jgi:hypothetical protein
VGPSLETMLPEAVIDRQITRQQAGALLRVWERHGIGTFIEEGLHKPLGLLVGSGRVVPGAAGLDKQFETYATALSLIARLHSRD